MSDERHPYLHVDVPEAQAELSSALLFELGAVGIEERDLSTLKGGEGPAGTVTLVASFPTEEEAREAARALLPRYEARVIFVEGDDWADAWRRHFKPRKVAERLYIRPSWEDFEGPDGSIVLTIDPGRAFGSGLHESTRLVLRAVERLIKGGEEILDVGCGSGILGVAALLFGARKVVAIDVDPAAAEVTVENALLNGVVDGIEASTLPIDAISGHHSLVLANIQANVLIEMSDALVKRVSPGGQLVLSGVLREQQEEVRGAFVGLHHRETLEEGEWVAMIFDKDVR